MIFVKILCFSLLCVAMGQDFDRLFETWGDGVTTPSSTSSPSTTAATDNNVEQNNNTILDSNNNQTTGKLSR
jgi:hypothetical protein